MNSVDELLDAVFGVREEVDFSDLAADFELPAGFQIASLATYPDGRSPLSGRPLGYTFSVQLLNTATGRMPRGTGDTVREAVERAIARA